MSNLSMCTQVSGRNGVDFDFIADAIESPLHVGREGCAERDCGKHSLSNDNVGLLENGCIYFPFQVNGELIPNVTDT